MTDLSSVHHYEILFVTNLSVAGALPAPQPSVHIPSVDALRLHPP